jgi:hypothetical protein
MMKRRGMGKELTIIVFSIFIFSALAFALDEDKTFRIQGPVMELDLKQNIVVVNEKLFVWNEQTVFRNERGTPIDDISRLKVRTWVYMEGSFGGLNKPHVVKNIYFLPKHIEEKEKNQYPFIIPFYRRK